MSKTNQRQQKNQDQSRGETEVHTPQDESPFVPTEDNPEVKPSPAKPAPAPEAPQQQPKQRLKDDLAGNVSHKDRVLFTLKEYCDMMALNRKQTPETSAEGALKLAECINNLLRTPAELYQSTMSAVIAQVKEKRDGLFHDRYIYRGFLSIGQRLGSSRADLITEVLSVILTAADSKSIADAVQRVSVTMVAERFTDQNEADKFIAFFKS